MAGAYPEGAIALSELHLRHEKMIHLERNIYSRSRLVPDTATIYVVEVDLVCRTLFLARSALSAIFLSKSGRFNFRTLCAEILLL
jgi:hypothetical protein